MYILCAELCAWYFHPCKYVAYFFSFRLRNCTLASVTLTAIFCLVVLVPLAIFFFRGSFIQFLALACLCWHWTRICDFTVYTIFWLIPVCMHEVAAETCRPKNDTRVLWNVFAFLAILFYLSLWPAHVYEECSAPLSASAVNEDEKTKQAVRLIPQLHPSPTRTPGSRTGATRTQTSSVVSYSGLLLLCISW